MELHDLTNRQSPCGVDGVSFPVFIKNGGYYLAELMVFRDGLVDCWETLDLALFEDKLISGWVRTGVPEGETINLRLMGALEVASPSWETTEDDLLRYVKHLIAQLNPQGERLVDMQGSATEFIDGFNRAKQYRKTSLPWLNDPGDPSGRRHTGMGCSACERVEGGFDIVEITLFQNDSVTVNGPQGIRQLSFAQFKTEAASGRFDFPKAGARVRLKGLGHFICGHAATRGYTATAIVAELEDVRDRLHGQIPSYEACRNAFSAFCHKPDAANLEKLRQAYERVPPHLRKYCGDMDTKDTQVRMALYGKAEIENWSHWNAAKILGLPVPHIDVPDVQD